jgi:hypothetical protein
MSVSQSSELNYTSELAQHSSARMSRVLPISGTGDITLQTGSTQEVTFELPNKVYNLARSTLDFNMNVAATASHVNSINSLGVQAIDRISLYTREGVYLADMPNFAQFSRVVTPLVTKHDDFMDNEPARGAVTEAAAKLADKGASIFKCDAVRGAAAAGVSDRQGQRVAAGGAALESNSESYVSPQYFVTSGTNGILNINYSIPLSEVHHSLMSIDRVMYFGQSLLLRVHFAPTDRMGFNADDHALTNAAALTSTVTISEAKVYLAVETNPMVVQGLVKRVQSQGLQVMVPYVYSYQYTSPANVDTSVQQRLNAGHGQRLLNSYHALFHLTNSGTTAMDINNVGNAKLVSFQTSLDNNNLQEFVPLCANNEDYQLIKPLLKGSVVSSSDCYRHNRVWIDSWRAGPCASWKERDGTEIDGLELTSERIWQIAQTGSGAAFRQYSWFVTQRTINVSSNGQILIA